jgi:hypothetical protein
VKAAAGLAVVAAAVFAQVALADSFTPVRMHVVIARVARAHKPLAVTVSVSADAGVLDSRDGPVHALVKLAAGECGSDAESTRGTVLLNRALAPQPSPGVAYSARATGHGSPRVYGVQHVCVFLEDASDHRVFANDTTSYMVNVSRPCTVAANRYDRSRTAVNRRRARSACGPGVPL